MKVVAAALGVRGIARDLGVAATVKLMTGSSAALGVSRRRGLGKLRHAELSQLWLQEKVEAKGVDIRKVRGEENRADDLLSLGILSCP